MDDKVNLAEKVALLRKPYKPGIVGYLNDYKLQIVDVVFPRFRGHLMAGPTGRPGRMSGDAQAAAVLAGVPI